MSDDTIESSVDDLSSLVTASPRNFPFLNSLRLSKEVISRLSLHLYRTSVGNSMVYLTPIGKDNDPKSILESFDKLFDSKLNLMNSTLREIENSNRSKFGPRSISKPWSERKTSMMKYFDSSSTYLPKLVKNNMRSALRPIDLSTGLSLLKNNTNSGLPYYTKKGKVKEKVEENYSKQIEAGYPCILFTRTQEAGKTRNVWGYPMSDTLREMLYYSPLLNFQRKQSWRSALVGPSNVDSSISSLMTKGRSLGLQFLSVDFSSYDSTVKPKLQKLAFSYIKDLFQNKYWEEIDQIAVRFSTIGIITPDGILSGPHGVPSGSTFTNEVDSIVQYLISTSVLEGSDLIQIQGDDGAYALNDKELEAVKEQFLRCGLELNEDKSYVSDSYLIYLQKLYHFDYMKDGFIGGIYSVYRALNRLIYQERYSDFEDFNLKGRDYYSLRAVCILENCKYHPLFKDLVKFVYDLDKYKLEFTQNSIKDYLSMVNNGKGAGGVVTNQYGDETSGINSFETIKLLKQIDPKYNVG